jgi:hypothetical protein
MCIDVSSVSWVMTHLFRKKPHIKGIVFFKIPSGLSLVGSSFSLGRKITVFLQSSSSSKSTGVEATCNHVDLNKKEEEEGGGHNEKGAGSVH